MSNKMPFNILNRISELFSPILCAISMDPHPLYGLVGPTKYDPTGTVAASSASSLTLRLPVPEQKEILILFFRKKI